jgi:hypothetical protein
MRQARLTHLSDIAEYDGVPGFIADDLIVCAIAQINRPCLIGAIKKHQCMRAGRLQPYQIGKVRNRVFRALQRKLEFPLQNEFVSQAADLFEQRRQIALPGCGICSEGGDTGCNKLREAIPNGTARPIMNERQRELTLPLQEAAHIFIRHLQAVLPLGITWVSSNQSFANFQGFVVDLQRVVKIALRP